MGMTIDRPAEAPPRERFRWGWLVAGVWLVYLVKPLQVMWTDSQGTERVVGIAAWFAFCITYLAYFGLVRRNPVTFVLAPMRYRLASMALLLALGLAMAPAAGEVALNTFVYVVAIAMMSMPLRAGVLVAAVLFVGAEVALRVVPGWQENGSYGFAIVLAAVAVFGLRRAMQRGWELAEARKDF